MPQKDPFDFKVGHSDGRLGVVQQTYKDPCRQIFRVATPPEPRGEKTTSFLCEFWAVKNFYNLLKSAGEKILGGLRGAKTFSVAFRIVFRIFFRVFQTVFRIDLNGQPASVT